MNLPLVSVIIPNYNHERYLDQRIESVLNQTYKNFEVIILDDCSTDNSKKIIEKYSNDIRISIIIYNDVNSGGTFHQWKKGIGLAKGEWIWIAESDDYSDHNFLNILITGIDFNSQIGIVFCNSIYVDECNNKLVKQVHKGLPIDIESTYNGSIFINEYMYRENNIPNASAVVFRKNLVDTGVIRTDFKLCGDWIFWIDLLQNTNILYLGQQKLNFYRIHETSVRNKTKELGFIKEYREIANCLLRKTNIKETTKASILDTLEYRYRNVLNNEQLTLSDKTIVFVLLLKLKLSKYL